ncbi:adenylate kinase [Tunicatimonas pelagia]|uniref:adenylate kinase n=1 Tax=Tunicatimonas pelagia TaxID=931531 RepID=UPI0026665CF4|nr:adenylate kinase [Tunicatimonas pelagia]WKN42519.1 adenylate kinase [Tunicatimonas pelagia]
MLNIVLFGPPGAGKGTQSQKLIEEFGLTHISTGDLFRKHLGEGTELGKKARAFMDEGRLVPDQLVIDMVDDRLREENNLQGIIFDGFPRTIPQAKALDELLNQKETPITGMIALSVPDDELIARIVERGKTSGRADDQDKAKIATRLQVYQTETLPVATYYETQGRYELIDGVGSIDNIYERIKEAVARLQNIAG